MRDSFRSLFNQPRVPNPPRRVWRDWVLVGILVPTAVAEALIRDNVVWGPFALGLAIALIFGLLWRRTYPLAVVAITFGTVTVVNIIAFATGAGEAGLYVSVVIALLPYALFRWGSGRHAAIGMAIIVTTAVTSSVTALLTDPSAEVVAEAVIGGGLFLALPAALGALVRYERHARLGEIEHVKLLEREQLARELHDSVAHHISAIVIQAQAGHTVAASHPEAAADALEVIEEEATRTLAEMRLMVRALRGDEGAGLAPQRGVADIEQLARNTGDTPHIDVQLSGDLDDLPRSVDTAIYRLAQESITNAVRHARNVSRVHVSVTGDATDVHLAVTDDGDPSPTMRPTSGYGLVGMNERATLLGGTLSAGPSPSRGWRVEAAIPRSGSRS